MTESAVEVVAPGWFSTVQDHGRPGLAHLGVSRSGALDPAAADLVNRVVGNPPGTPVLETGGGLVLRARGAVVVAVSTDGAAITLAAGDEIDVDTTHGVRNVEYVAVRGGLVVAPVLGSASHDTLSGIGPPPVAAGTVYPVGPEPATPVATAPAPPGDGPDRLRLWPGPRLDWFAPDALDLLCGQPWTITPALSRIGARLRGRGRLPERVRTGELPSEGLVRGAVQLPPGGEPVVMLADHPTTGGYPVVAVVDHDHLVGLVRRRPGRHVRFTAAAADTLPPWSDASTGSRTSTASPARSADSDA